MAEMALIKMAPCNHDLGLLRADQAAAATIAAKAFLIKQDRPTRDGFRIMAPATAEVTALQENGGPDPGTITDRNMLYLADKALHVNHHP